MIQPSTLVEVCNIIGTELVDCERYVTDVYFGWYFESTRYACQFPVAICLSISLNVSHYCET